MTYKLTEQWQHKSETEFDTLEESVAAGALVVRAHPDALVVVQGHGISVNVWPERVAVTA